MQLTNRELDAILQYCDLVSTVPELHEQWYESEDQDRLSDEEIKALSDKIKQEVKARSESYLMI